MKFCKDCKYCKVEFIHKIMFPFSDNKYSFADCTHPKSFRKNEWTDKITGKHKIYERNLGCSIMRLLAGDCGHGAKYFEPKNNEGK